MNITKFFVKKKSNVNFFELPSREKKKLIKNAVKGSNELQEKLVKNYNGKFVY